jgi:hypothetical protein
LNRLKYLGKYLVRSGFGVPELANPNRTEPVRFKNEKKNKVINQARATPPFH